MVRCNEDKILICLGIWKKVYYDLCCIDVFVERILIYVRVRIVIIYLFYYLYGCLCFD